MPDIELFLKEKLNPLYKVHYPVWVHWWPLWRDIYSGQNILRKWEQSNLIKEEQALLDYGCGTGSFTILMARIAGAKGKVYALDCFPRQLEIVKKRAKKEGLTNIETILSDNGTGLPDECIDIVWMCDVFHEVEQRRAVLEEMHRVLRREGVMAVYDGMKDRVLSYTAGLFSLTEMDGKFLRFTKIS